MFEWGHGGRAWIAAGLMVVGSSASATQTFQPADLLTGLSDSVEHIEDTAAELSQRAERGELSELELLKAFADGMHAVIPSGFTLAEAIDSLQPPMARLQGFWHLARLDHAQSELSRIDAAELSALMLAGFASPQCADSVVALIRDHLSGVLDAEMFSEQSRALLPQCTLADPQAIKQLLEEALPDEPPPLPGDRCLAQVAQLTGGYLHGSYRRAEVNQKLLDLDGVCDGVSPDLIDEILQLIPDPDPDLEPLEACADHAVALLGLTVSGQGRTALVASRAADVGALCGSADVDKIRDILDGLPGPGPLPDPGQGEDPPPPSSDYPQALISLFQDGSLWFEVGGEKIHWLAGVPLPILVNGPNGLELVAATFEPSSDPLNPVNGVNTTAGGSLRLERIISAGLPSRHGVPEHDAFAAAGQALLAQWPHSALAGQWPIETTGAGMAQRFAEDLEGFDYALAINPVSGRVSPVNITSVIDELAATALANANSCEALRLSIYGYLYLPDAGGEASAVAANARANLSMLSEVAGTTLFAGIESGEFPRKLIASLEATVPNALSPSLATLLPPMRNIGIVLAPGVPEGAASGEIEITPSCEGSYLGDVLENTGNVVLDSSAGTAANQAAYNAAIADRASGSLLGSWLLDDLSNDFNDSFNGSGASVSGGGAGSSPDSHNSVARGSGGAVQQGPFSSPPDVPIINFAVGKLLGKASKQDAGSKGAEFVLRLPVDLKRTYKASATVSSGHTLNAEIGATPPTYAALDVNTRGILPFGIDAGDWRLFGALQAFGLAESVRMAAGNGGTAGNHAEFESADPIRELSLFVPIPFLEEHLGFRAGVFRVPELVTFCAAPLGICPNPGTKSHDLGTRGSFRFEASEPTFPYVSLNTAIGSIATGMWLHKAGGWAGYSDTPAAWLGFDTDKTEIGGGTTISKVCGSDGCEGDHILEAAMLAWFKARELILALRWPPVSMKGGMGCHSNTHFTLNVAGDRLNDLISKVIGRICGLIQFNDGSDAMRAVVPPQSPVPDILLLGNPACQRVAARGEDLPNGGLVDQLLGDSDPLANLAGADVYASVDEAYEVACDWANE